MRKYRTEILMALFAIAMYLFSAFCYSYETSGMSSMTIFPFRSYAFTLTGVGFLFFVSAGIMYSKRK